MGVQLTRQDLDMLDGAAGPAASMALRIVAGTARMLGAGSLLDIASAHIDGCLYHGPAGTLFAERLVALGGQVRVPATLNVGALDLLHAGRVRLEAEAAALVLGLIDAILGLGILAAGEMGWKVIPLLVLEIEEQGRFGQGEVVEISEDGMIAR